MSSEIQKYVSISEVSSINRVIDVLISLKPSFEQSPNVISLAISQFRFSTFKRLLGLLRHEISWKLKIAKNPPYSHCFPGGISRKDFNKVISLKDQTVPVKVRAITLNCWEFS